MGSLSDILASFKKDYGEGIGDFDSTEEDTERLPFDIFALDLSLGGGIPRGRVSIIYGPEASNKTNLVYKLIASHQKRYPELTCVFIDQERTYDAEWAANFGVDNKKLLHLRPAFAEQVVDMAETVLYSEEVGFIAIDSLAAMTTMNQVEKSSEVRAVGGNALVVKSLVGKITTAMNIVKNEGRLPTVVYINQIQHKIGVMYGNPETMPGGFAPKFQASLILRVYGREESDKTIHKTLPTSILTSTIIKKKKFPVLATVSEFSMITVPHKGLKVGEVDDWNTIEKYLREFGLLIDRGAKSKVRWQFGEFESATLKGVKEHIMEDKELYVAVKECIISKCFEAIDGPIVEEDD